MTPGGGNGNCNYCQLIAYNVAAAEATYACVCYFSVCDAYGSVSEFMLFINVYTNMQTHRGASEVWNQEPFGAFGCGGDVAEENPADVPDSLPFEPMF